MLNCRQATLLIERTAGQLPRCGTLLPLRVHLRLCPLCSRYEQQTHLLARLVRYPAGHGPVQLREAFKTQLREQIRQRLRPE